MKPVKDLRINKNTKITELLSQMNDIGGFTAKKLATGIEIFESMKDDKECIKFLSFPACIISTGLRGVIKDIIKNKLVDVVITTCGTLDHDLARIWKDYYQGSFDMDDNKLFKQGINRLGNVLIPNDSYGTILEDKMQEFLKEITKEKKNFSTREIIDEFGKRINNEDSILYWAHKNNIPIFVPGITDGAFGSQLWMFRQKDREFNIDVLRDEEELAEIIFKAKKTGALMIGGGISKHHVIWWNQFKDGLDYVIYITTAPEWDGSLSGARIREAVSWGKVKEKAKYITIEGDATVLLPLLITKFL
jgi:deoxyhypusine synthase